MVDSAIRSRSLIVCVTPLRNSCRPLKIAERVGAQVGLTWKSVNRVDMRVEAIEVRRLQHLVAHARQVAHALIVGHDQDDVGRVPASDSAERRFAANSEARQRATKRRKSGNGARFRMRSFPRSRQRGIKSAFSSRHCISTHAQGPTCFALLWTCTSVHRARAQSLATVLARVIKGGQQ